MDSVGRSKSEQNEQADISHYVWASLLSSTQLLKSLVTWRGWKGIQRPLIGRASLAGSHARVFGFTSALRNRPRPLASWMPIHTFWGKARPLSRTAKRAANNVYSKLLITYWLTLFYLRQQNSGFIVEKVNQEATLAWGSSLHHQLATVKLLSGYLLNCN